MTGNKNFQLSFLLCVILLLLFFLLSKISSNTNNLSSSTSISSSTLSLPMEEFPEPPWRTSTTLDARTIVSTKFARFEVHKVKTESGAIVNDWLWTDERSHVNILVCYFPHSLFPFYF